MKLLSRICFALMLLFTAGSAAAQFGFKARHYYYVHTDTINVRAEPGFSGAILKTFHKGDSLMVLKVGAKMTIRHKSAPWCEVGYRIGNSERRGMVWGGFLVNHNS